MADRPDPLEAVAEALRPFEKISHDRFLMHRSVQRITVPTQWVRDAAAALQAFESSQPVSGGPEAEAAVRTVERATGQHDIATPEQKAAAIAWLRGVQLGGNMWEAAHATVLLDWVDAPAAPAPALTSRAASPAVGPVSGGLTAEQAKALLRWTERATLRPPAVVGREFQALLDARDFLRRRLAEGATDRAPSQEDDPSESLLAGEGDSDGC